VSTGPAGADETRPPDPAITINDKRRIDPDGEVPLVPSAPQEAPAEPGQSYLEDLQRLKAEFDNYRRRVERDRVEWGINATARLVGELLGVLDDIDRARSHGELDPGFRSVADGLEKALFGSGVERFGAPGELFDPARHEALTHVPKSDVNEEVVLEVYRPGYLFHGRVLRPAQVVVAGPLEDPQPPGDEPGPDAARFEASA
jgi:molecular chaperone GrpE